MKNKLFYAVTIVTLLTTSLAMAGVSVPCRVSMPARVSVVSRPATVPPRSAATVQPKAQTVAIAKPAVKTNNTTTMPNQTIIQGQNTFPWWMFWVVDGNKDKDKK